MPRSRRTFSVFTFAFLDVMCCGFGAVLLVFLITRHQVNQDQHPPSYDLDAEIHQLQGEIGGATRQTKDAQAKGGDVAAQLAALRQRIVDARGELAEAQKGATPQPLLVTAKDIELLRAAVKKLEAEKHQLESQLNEHSEAIRTFSGAGNRQYLTGIKLGGQRIAVIVAVSASMLDSSIVNVVRKRNMDDAAKRRSEKWQQALAVVDWITARFPANCRYQLIAYNNTAHTLVPDSDGRWLDAGEVDTLNRAVAGLKQSVPDGGANLAAAFQAVARLSPLPDNVFLITDKLPTQGLKPVTTPTVSGAKRLELFEEAAALLPPGVPVNTILLPMEGDPYAASAYWKIAMTTRGSFLTPSYDWP
jgi:hypothetical protein